MYARTVTIGDQTISISCCPDTPLSQVLERAARVMKDREAALKRNADNKAIAEMLGR